MIPTGYIVFCTEQNFYFCLGRVNAVKRQQRPVIVRFDEVVYMNELNVRLLTIDETCKILGGITRQTLWSWAKQGRIPRLKLGDRLVRFRETDVLDFRRKSIDNMAEMAQ